MIELVCECGQKFIIPDEYCGKRGKCHKCDNIMAIPEPMPEEPNVGEETETSSGEVSETTPDLPEEDATDNENFDEEPAEEKSETAEEASEDLPSEKEDEGTDDDKNDRRTRRRLDRESKKSDAPDKESAEERRARRRAKREKK